VATGEEPGTLLLLLHCPEGPVLLLVLLVLLLS
jgi:hypothetical protein